MKDKRLELLKLIINSDDKGIEKIYEKIFNINEISFSKENFKKIAAKVASEMILDVPGRVMIMDDYVEYAVRIEKLLFKEEK